MKNKPYKAKPLQQQQHITTFSQVSKLVSVYKQESLITAKYPLAIGNQYSLFDESTAYFQNTILYNISSTLKALTFSTSVIILSRSLVPLKKCCFMESTHFPSAEEEGGDLTGQDHFQL